MAGIGFRAGTTNANTGNPWGGPVLDLRQTVATDRRLPVHESWPPPRGPEGSTNANTGTRAALPSTPEYPYQAPVLHGIDTGGHDEELAYLQRAFVPHPPGFNGYRVAEGHYAQGWAASFASSQIDLPPNLVARLAPGISRANADRFDGFDLVDSGLLTQPTSQSGGTPAYMRPSDDLTLFEQEVTMIEHWLLGAP